MLVYQRVNVQNSSCVNTQDKLLQLQAVSFGRNPYLDPIPSQCFPRFVYVNIPIFWLYPASSWINCHCWLNTQVLENTLQNEKKLICMTHLLPFVAKTK